jgi:DNA-binding transcriptional LysR family regulator
MGLDLDLAASFVALVDEWGYGRAAKSLHVSIPTVTKRVNRPGESGDFLV